MRRKAIYPGSFDPITNGHCDIVQRALMIFDEVYIGVIENPQKNTLFSIEERIQIIQHLFKDNPRVHVEGFEGLLVDFAKIKNIYTMIRGLRAVSDFDYECQMSHTNRHLCPQLDTVFLMTDAKYSYLSSSLVKQVARYHGDISHFVPAEIETILKDRYHE
jgi:pantetheine-phosphate adenylyltransferase